MHKKTLEEIEYDENVKKFLSQKIILAHILVNTVREFFGMSPDDVIPYIEDPVISTVKVDASGNLIKEFVKSGSRIKGLNTEDSSREEGTIYFDIKFMVYSPAEKQYMRMYVDIEAQNKYNPGYSIIKRGVYYCSRMISSQKETEFSNSDYDEIKKVYSIWICTDCPSAIENSITEISLQQNNIVGCVPDNKDYDLFSIIIVGLSKEVVNESDEHKLHRLLETFFSAVLSEDEKRAIIEKEYGITYSEEIERSVSQVCNVSQGLVEKGRAEGMIKILFMQGNSPEEISQELMSQGLQLSVKEIENVLSALGLSDN